MTPEEIEEINEARKLNERIFQQAQLVRLYFKEVNDLVTGIIKKNPKEITIHGYLLRVICFLETLNKCNDVKDFQTVIQINRALIECSVDLTLLVYDIGSSSDDKIRVWERSAKLKSALCVVKYFSEKGLAIPDYCKPQEYFVNLHNSDILNERKRCWNSEQHPDRWTGPGRSLQHDVKEADKLHPSGLVELYELEYRRYNWFAHGSGLTAIREMESVAYFHLCGSSYSACSKLAMLCAELALNALGFFQFSDIYRERWQEVSRVITAQALPIP